MQKPQRNDPCPCGSGKKFKQCCMSKENTPQKSQTPTIQSLKDRIQGKKMHVIQSGFTDFVQKTFEKQIAEAEKLQQPPKPTEELLNVKWPDDYEPWVEGEGSESVKK